MRQAGLAHRDDLLSGVVIEGRVSGTSAVQTLRATVPDWLAERTIAFPVGQRGKMYRAKQASVWCERVDHMGSWCGQIVSAIIV